MKSLRKILFLLTLIPVAQIKTAEKNFRPLEKQVELSASEKFVKELYQENAPLITFLRMHEVSPDLTNKLNVLFTPQIQKAFIELNFKFLKRKGFKFFGEKIYIFSHKNFRNLIFKFSDILLSEKYSSQNISQSTLKNASRIVYAQWIKIIQNKYKVPTKKIYFMKSNFPQLAIVVIAEKIKNFDKGLPIMNVKKINGVSQVVFNRDGKEELEKFGYLDWHDGNVRGKYIIDTEFRGNLATGNILTSEPFTIYNNPLGIKNNIRSKL